MGDETEPLPGEDSEADKAKATEKRRRELICKIEIARVNQRAYWEDLRLIVTLAVEEMTATRLKLLEDYVRAAATMGADPGTVEDDIGWQSLIFDILLAAAIACGPQLLLVRLGAAALLRSVSLMRMGTKLFKSSNTIASVLRAEKRAADASRAIVWSRDKIIAEHAKLSQFTREAIAETEEQIISSAVKESINYLSDMFVADAGGTASPKPAGQMRTPAAGRFAGRASQPPVQVLGAMLTWINARTAAEAMVLAKLQCQVSSLDEIDAELFDDLSYVLGEGWKQPPAADPPQGVTDLPYMPAREILQREMEAFLWAWFLKTQARLGSMDLPTVYPGPPRGVETPAVTLSQVAVNQAVFAQIDQLKSAAMQQIFPGVLNYLLDRILVPERFQQGLITYRDFQGPKSNVEHLLERFVEIRDNYDFNMEAPFREALQRR